MNKTRMVELPDGEKTVKILCVTVYAQYRRVTADGQTYRFLLIRSQETMPPFNTVSNLTVGIIFWPPCIGVQKENVCY